MSLQIGLQAERRDFDNLLAAISQTRADINLTHLIISNKKKAHRNEMRDIEKIYEREAQKPEMAKRAVEK